MLPTVRVCTNHVISTDRVDDDYSSNLLGAFTKLQKKNYSAASCPSVHPHETPTGRIFMQLDIWAFFTKSVLKIQVSLKSARITGTLHENIFIFETLSR
jgi:hypothetical protein